MAEHDQKTSERPQEESPRQFSANLPLEVCFLVFVGLIAVAAFFEALTYAIVSSRTPFVIMVPLFILIVVQALRVYRARGQAHVMDGVMSALRGHMPDFNKVIKLSASFVGILVLIVIFGHFVAIFTFCFLLMWRAGKESLMLSAMIAAGTTLFIYLVFEMAFDIEFYRGLIIRYFLGYRDFG